MRSVLVFSIWLFNANNHGNTALTNKILNLDLPAEFYTTAAIVSPMMKLQFDSTFLKVFIVLQGIVLVALKVALLWLFPPWSTGAWLVTSPFPALDFLFKAEVLDGALGVSVGGLRTAERLEIIKRGNEAVVYSATSANLEGMRERKRAGAMPY